MDTVYLGGGTPSLLEPDLLSRLFVAVRAQFDLDADAEITLECAPGQLADATLDAIAASGVNRVSLGVQSFVDSEAHASGRLHNRTKVEQDLQRLRAAGIANLNVDLIAGLAGQTFASWDESLSALIESGVPHASVYMLEVDEDSRLGREVLKRGARYRADLVPSDDAIARMYERAIERLEEAGLMPVRDLEFRPPRTRVEAQPPLLAAAAVSGRRPGCVIHVHCMEQPPLYQNDVPDGQQNRAIRGGFSPAQCCGPRRPTT